MPLVIETGAGVANANSFASVAELVAYAAARALTLPDTDAEKEALLVLAGDFLNSLEPQYRGSRLETDQTMCWPRQDVYLFGASEAEEEDSIPQLLKDAQCQLAYDAISQSLQPTGAGREVLREKVDVIEVEYAERGSGTITPYLAKAMGILGPLLKHIGLRTLRV